MGTAARRGAEGGGELRVRMNQEHIQVVFAVACLCSGEEGSEG